MRGEGKPDIKLTERARNARAHARGMGSTIKIPLSNGRYLVDIKFTRYSGYDEYKPIFEVEGTDIEKKELKIEDKESKYYPTDFLTLYQKALEL